MNLYAENDYRNILRTLVEERRAVESGFNFQRLAEAIGIQKSYLSKVMGGTAELSTDQLFLACDYLHLNTQQTDYLMLLLELSRCQLKKRRELLLARIQKIQSKHRETKEHLSAKSPQMNSKEDLTLYYLDPIHQIVHVCLSIRRYQSDLARLAKDLKLSASRVMESVQLLEQMNVVERHDGRVRVLIDSVHLPRESPVYTSWRSQMKILSLQRLQNLEKDQAYSFSVVFSANPEVRNRMQLRFLEMLQEVEGWVKEADSEQTYQLNFDLFSWT